MLQTWGINDTMTKGRVQMASTTVRTSTTEIVVTHLVAHLDESADAVIREFAKAKEDIKVLEEKEKRLPNKKNSSTTWRLKTWLYQRRKAS